MPLVLSSAIRLFRSPTLSVAATLNRTFSMASPAPSFLGFHLVLIQLGQIGPDKAKNLQHAKDMVHRAATGDNGRHPKPDLIVLPECFNSP